MNRIHIEVSKAYDIYIGSGLIHETGKLMASVAKSDRTVIVTDDTVSELWLDAVQISLENSGYEALYYVLPKGEKSKNIRVLSDILEFLASNRIRRRDALIALGGGVVGDIAGLAAAMYMRGMQLVQIPTTLLAAVDSSVGGKTAINLDGGKNLAGAFYQPDMVICDTEVIRKLPDEIFAEGMAEVIKCGVISRLPITDLIEENRVKDNLKDIISMCVSLKRDIVEQDESDTEGIRNILNAGHTMAHAIEKVSGYTISHGMAVGTGMVMEAQLALKLGLCERETADRITEAVRRYGLLTHIDCSSEELIEAMKSDKKNRDGGIVFVLPCETGWCREVTVGEEELGRNLAEIEKND